VEELADFSDLVAEKIPECKDLATKQEKFGEAVERLLALEKKTRQGGDSISTAKVLVAFAEICFACKEYKALNENIVAFAKRRGLLKESIKKLVKTCITFLDTMAYDAKLELMNTLLDVTEGKIYVEKQRARLTLKLAKMREAEGKIDEAAKILQEVQIETFGAMKKKEKTEYILEQMRLCLKKQDYVRTQIISRKINPRVLLEADMYDCKVQYYELMVQYYLGSSRNHFEVATCYNHIYDSPAVKQDVAKQTKYLQLIVLYLILSEYTNAQSDFINRLAKDLFLPKLPVYESIVKSFLTHEVMNHQDTVAKYKQELDKLEPFSNPEEAKRLWDDLALRIVEHNIRVIARYYTRITSKRLCQLLSLPYPDVEKHISRLVVKGSIWAKIDRPSGIMVFKKTEHPSDILNNWASDVDSLLKVVEKTCHLIQRENMVHKSQKASTS